MNGVCAVKASWNTWMCFNQCILVSKPREMVRTSVAILFITSVAYWISPSDTCRVVLTYATAGRFSPAPKSPQPQPPAPDDQQNGTIGVFTLSQDVLQAGSDWLDQRTERWLKEWKKEEVPWKTEQEVDAKRPEWSAKGWQQLIDGRAENYIMIDLFVLCVRIEMVEMKFAGDEV